MTNRMTAITTTLGLALGLGLSTALPAKDAAEGPEPFIGEVRISAQTTVEDSSGARSTFQVAYVGNGTSGSARMIMTDADGTATTDDARDCALSVGGTRWTIVCTNPHFVTWDSIYYNVDFGPELGLSSEILTDGRLQFMRIVEPVRISATYGSLPREN